MPVCHPWQVRSNGRADPLPVSTAPTACGQTASTSASGDRWPRSRDWLLAGFCPLTLYLYGMPGTNRSALGARSSLVDPKRSCAYSPTTVRFRAEWRHKVRPEGRPASKTSDGRRRPLRSSTKKHCYSPNCFSTVALHWDSRHSLDAMPSPMIGEQEGKVRVPVETDGLVALIYLPQNC